MSLTKEYFDKINIELVKRKYYNANKVDALLSEIRAGALALSDENSRLKAQLDTFVSQKAEIGEAVMSAQLMSSDIVQKANAKADELTSAAEAKAAEILAEAQEKAQKLIDDARVEAQGVLESSKQQEEKARAIHDELLGCKHRRQEYTVDKVENCFALLRQQHQEAIDTLNQQWQEFLCGLYEDESFPDPDSIHSDTQAGTVDAEAGLSQEAPADLGDKVVAIANELSELENTAG